MSSTFWKSVFISPAVVGIALLLATGVKAAPASSSVRVAATEVSPAPTTASPEVATDLVKPGDWQYTALQAVAAKYGCNTNLNDRAVSQVDFARGLNTCLSKVEPMLAQQPTSVTAEDLEVIKRLTQEFRAQLTEVDNRLVTADKRIAQAQANQFSTTTKLKGEAIFNLSGAVSGVDNKNTVLGDRVRLLFESSFNGQDKLWTRLAANNQLGVNSTLRNGPTGEGAQVAEGGTNNSVGIDWLAYQFPVYNTNVYVAAFNGIHVDYAPSYGSNFEDFTGGSGALSSFAESSPIYKIGGGAGVGTNFPVSPTGLTSVSVGYFAGGAAGNPAAGNGLFNGDNSLLGQLNFKFSDKFDAGLTYVSSYHTGTNPIFGFGAGGVGLTGSGIANAGTNGTKANSYGAQFAYKASDTVAFNGFVMNTNANKSTGKEDIWSYGAGLSLPNLDGKGGLVGLMVGAEPYVGGTGSTPFHIEGFYKYKLSDNLSITPGLIYLTAPNQASGNGAVIGTVRTTFTF
jgi:Carbohydrate-selective porin, OprB family